MKEEHQRFLEETLLTVLLWIGAWGFISSIMDEYVGNLGLRLILYCVSFLVAFRLLQIRNHI